MRLAVVTAALYLFIDTSFATPPPVEAFGRIPKVADVVISPAGKLLAWGDNSGEAQLVIIYDIESTTQKRKLNMPAGARLRELDWADDETLLISLSFAHREGPRPQDQYEWLRTIAVDANGGEMRMLLMDDRRSLVTGANLVALRTPTPKTVLMASWDFAMTKYREEIGSRLHGGRKDDGWTYNLFEVDTRTGKGKMIEQGSTYTVKWIVDNGVAIARVEYDAAHKLSRILRKDGQGWDQIHESSELLAAYGLTQDRTALMAVGALSHERNALWTIPLDGSGARIQFEDPHNDVESLVLDKYSWRPVGASIGGARPEVHWLDADAEARFTALTKSFGGLNVAVASQSADRSRLIARVTGPSAGGIYYLVDFKQRKADIVGEDYPDLAGVPLAEVRVISYKSRDGVDIPAYLTLPPIAQQLNLPLVVMPHGGPEARDEFTFDWSSQFFASRGYAVLRPQFRGSTGFGEAFRLAGYHQWGGTMQNDVTDGVKALVEQGLVDPRRVCIVGASYGGYAALAGAAFTPDLYACAASIGGVSDLPAMLANVERHNGEESDALAYWNEHIGSAIDPAIAASSPARAAGKIKAPVLLLHGVNDTVVPIAQSQLMANALRDAGKPYSFIKLESEDHWLSRSETRVRVLKELDIFLAKYLGASAP